MSAKNGSNFEEHLGHGGRFKPALSSRRNLEDTEDADLKREGGERMDDLFST